MTTESSDPQGLDAFFDAMRPWLLGELPTDALEARLGASPSGSDALAFYPRFLRRHERLLLQRQFKAAYLLIDRHSPVDWGELVQAFVRAHVPTSWSMYRTGEPFAAWLGEQIDAGRPIPPEAPELVDFNWTRWLARNAPHDAPLLEGQVFVRQYSFDVPAFTRALVEDPDVRPATQGPRTLVIFRHREDGDVFHFTPSLATLAVLDRASGNTAVDWAAHGLTDAMLAQEHDELIRRGLLPG